MLPRIDLLQDRKGNRSTMSKPKALVVNPALLAVLALAGCNTPSIEDLQRVEYEVAELRARVEAAEARRDASAALADLALDSAGQCGQVCLQVSDRLDELYLEITPR
jgi:outer membrane murein-binding lipoprotein Lpp